MDQPARDRYDRVQGHGDIGDPQRHPDGREDRSGQRADPPDVGVQAGRPRTDERVRAQQDRESHQGGPGEADRGPGRWFRGLRLRFRHGRRQEAGRGDRIEGYRHGVPRQGGPLLQQVPLRAIADAIRRRDRRDLSRMRSSETSRTPDPSRGTIPRSPPCRLSASAPRPPPWSRPWTPLRLWRRARPSDRGRCPSCRTDRASSPGCRPPADL